MHDGFSNTTTMFMPDCDDPNVSERRISGRVVVVILLRLSRFTWPKPLRKALHRSLRGFPRLDELAATDAPGVAASSSELGAGVQHGRPESHLFRGGIGDSLGTLRAGDTSRLGISFTKITA